MTDLRVAYYGDDVTGSVDVLLQFARLGLAGRLFIGIPDALELATAASDCTVVGVAGIARSLPTPELEAEVRPAFEALRALDGDIVQYKACSTADSSPAIGNLGRVLEIAREVFGDRTVPALFAQPDFGRYTVFGHHFAAEGGIVHRLDRQPTMSVHPSTPMDESDLAAHLRRQTALPIGSLPLTGYTSAVDLARSLGTSTDAAVILDALDDGHLSIIGDALAALSREGRPVFAIGSGGLSRAVALSAATASAALPGSSVVAGPVLVVSGSRSAQTRRQTEAAASAGWLVEPLPLDGRCEPALEALHAGRSVVLTADDAELDGDPLPAIAQAAASVVRAALQSGATARIVVCGGDTSGRVVRLLGVRSLSIAANPAANVVLLRAGSDEPSVDGAELLLKGGQVGDDELFTRVAHGFA